MGPEPVVAEGLRRFAGLGDDRLQSLEVARLHQRERQMGEEFRSDGILFGHQRDRAGEEAHRRRHVLANERTATGGPETLRGGSPHGRDAVADRPELRKRSVRRLEVIADDLLDLGRPFLLAALDPPREALVQLRPPGFRDLLVRGVADEDVREAEGVLLDCRVVGADQLLASERLEMVTEPGAQGVR